MQLPKQGEPRDRKAREEAVSPRPKEQSAWLRDEPVTVFPPPSSLPCQCVFPPPTALTPHSVFPSPTDLCGQGVFPPPTALTSHPMFPPPSAPRPTAFLSRLAIPSPPPPGFTSQAVLPEKGLLHQTHWLVLQ